MTDAEKIAKIREEITHRRDLEQAEIASFKHRLDNDPVRAFESADASVMAAVRIAEADRVLSVVDSVERGDVEIDQLIPSLVKIMSYELPLNMGGSTSAMRNVVAQAWAVGASEWVSDRQRGSWLKYIVTSILRME